MNDSWFDEYLFEIAARKSYLPAALRAALEEEPIVLPAWDPMGSLRMISPCPMSSPCDCVGRGAPARRPFPATASAEPNVPSPERGLG